MLVVINHLIALHPALQAIPHINMLNWGTESVMLFFVLSGVVINLSLDRRPVTPLQFLRNRLLRLYPQFLVGIALALVAMFLTGTVLPTGQALVGNLLMLGTLQGYVASVVSTNNPLWSLAFEMAFYLTFGLCLCRWRPRLMQGWALLALGSMALYYTDTGHGWLNHVVAIFAFSTLWLVGYFLYQYRHSVTFTPALRVLSLGLLPLASRVHFADTYYDQSRA